MHLSFRRLRLTDLIELCRSLRFSLSSGLMLRDVMDLLSSRGSPRVRRLAGQVARELKAGWSLQEALEKQEGVVPPLFLSLVAVGEESGNLPEVLGELEKYYALRLRLWRELTQQIAWPLFQFVAAVLVVTMLIYVMGVLPRADLRAPPLDPLGLGLSGPRGAVIFLSWVVGVLGGAVVLFYLLRWLLARRAVVEQALLFVPGVGPCLRALALTRLCMAGRLMLETSLSIRKTMRLAFLATDNAAFIGAYPRVEGSLRQGNSITTSLERAGLFPPVFLGAVGVGEESGRLPETLRHQGEEYDDEARRRLSWLTRVAAGLIWLCVAAVIITCVFRIFNEAYLKSIDRVMPSSGRYRSLFEPPSAAPRGGPQGAPSESGAPRRGGAGER